MKVLKFGGTSVGSPQRMQEVSKLITEDGENKFVVLSAMSGTTNTLVEISDYLYKKNPEGANTIMNQLEQTYVGHIEKLYQTEEIKQKTLRFLHDEFDYLRSFTKVHFTSFEEKVILAQGEIISTNMVVNYLQECGVKALLINALDIIRTDKNAEPDMNYIKDRITKLLEANPGYQIYLTQGFICRNAYGEIDNLLRGGSDYTACGQTSTECTTTTRASWSIQSQSVSCTSKRLPSLLTLARRYCIRPVFSRPSSLAFPSVFSIRWTQKLLAPSSTTTSNEVSSKRLRLATTTSASR